MNPKDCLGPGDSETWPMFAGHPHDPRAPEDDSNDTTAESLSEIREWLAIAEIAHDNGDLRRRSQALKKAKAVLEEALA